MHSEERIAEIKVQKGTTNSYQKVEALTKSIQMPKQSSLPKMTVFKTGQHHTQTLLISNAE